MSAILCYLDAYPGAGTVARGRSQELDLGGDKWRRNIVDSEQKYESAQSLLLTGTRL